MLYLTLRPRLFDTLHTLFNWIFLYWVSVTKYGQPASIDTPHWSLVSSVPFTFLIALIVQVNSPPSPTMHVTTLTPRRSSSPTESGSFQDVS